MAMLQNSDQPASAKQPRTVGGLQSTDARLTQQSSGSACNAGELWTPSGRLLDWSYAGYKANEEDIPTVAAIAGELGCRWSRLSCVGYVDIRCSTPRLRGKAD
jgi:hypothetical protein